MEQFIKQLGIKLKSDIMLYYIFKFIILHLNFVLLLVSLTLNIVMYVIIAPLPNAIISAIMLTINVLLTIAIFFFGAYNFGCWVDEDPYVFNTKKYKRIFDVIEYKS